MESNFGYKVAFFEQEIEFAIAQNTELSIQHQAHVAHLFPLREKQIAFFVLFNLGNPQSRQSASADSSPPDPWSKMSFDAIP